MPALAGEIRAGTQVPQIRSPPLFEKLRDHGSDDLRASVPRGLPGRHQRAGRRGQWDGIRTAFAGFDPATIASLQPADTARLEADPRVIRNSVKIQANSRERPGTPSHSAPARHCPEVPCIVPQRTLSRQRLAPRFQFLGDTGVRRLLATAAYDAG
jgi:hypothetical protein